MTNKKTAPKKTATKKVTKKTVAKTTKKIVSPKESVLNKEISAKNSFLVILLAAFIVIAAALITLY